MLQASRRALCAKEDHLDCTFELARPWHCTMPASVANTFTNIQGEFWGQYWETWVLNQVILSNASHLCKYFYKHTGCAKKVAYRVLMTMLGNLFIELGYLGPFEQNATLSPKNMASQHSTQKSVCNFSGTPCIYCWWSCTIDEVRGGYPYLIQFVFFVECFLTNLWIVIWNALYYCKDTRNCQG